MFRCDLCRKLANKGEPQIEILEKEAFTGPVSCIDLDAQGEPYEYTRVVQQERITKRTGICVDCAMHAIDTEGANASPKIFGRWAIEVLTGALANRIARLEKYYESRGCPFSMIRETNREWRVMKILAPGIQAKA